MNHMETLFVCAPLSKPASVMQEKEHKTFSLSAPEPNKAKIARYGTSSLMVFFNSIHGP